MLEQQDGDECRQNPDMHRVGASADEGFHPQVLFECFEEPFDLPAFPVAHRDSGAESFKWLVSNTRLSCLSSNQTWMRREVFPIMCLALTHWNSIRSFVRMSPSVVWLFVSVAKYSTFDMSRVTKPAF